MADIHEAALRTVARISFTLGALGCVEDPTESEFQETDGSDEAQADAAVEPSDIAFVEVPDGALPDSLIVFPEDAGALADGDFLADALGADAEADAGIDSEPDMTPEGDAGETPCQGLIAAEEWEEHSKCCEEIGWDPNLDPSCTPWGPPVPPSMPQSKRVAR